MSESAPPQGPEHQFPPPYGAAPPPGYPPQYGAAPPPGYGPPGQPRTDDTIWGILAHLSIFVFALIAPLVIYLVFKDTSTFARHHAAEALNFHITLLIATLVSIPLVFVLIGIPLLIAIVIASFVFAILATIAASRREPYRYPLTIHFVS